MRRTVSSAVVAAAALALLGAGCGGSGSAAGKRLTLVAYSTPQQAYEGIIRAFRARPGGADVEVEQSYGASGEQSRAVAAGLPADVVAFSLEPDVTRLVEAGLVDETWNRDAYRGMVTSSVVVLVVRRGNPKGIRGWDDLLAPGVEVVTPNPFTSGGARWNILAGYGAQLAQGRTKEQAVEYLRRLFEHVVVQDKSARESLMTFTAGKGDVMIAYENEAITAQRQGEALEYVVPDQTILIENPAAVTSGAPPVAKAFHAFLRSEEAQRIFGEAGYRPVVPSVLETFDYPTPPGLFTVRELGGWERLEDELFDRDTGAMAEIESELGVGAGG